MEKSLQQRISTKSFSRIEEMCQFIEITGKNLRQKKIQKKCYFLSYYKRRNFFISLTIL